MLGTAPAELGRLVDHDAWNLAVPTPDHFLPVAYLAGLAAAGGRPVDVLVEGLRLRVAVDDRLHARSPGRGIGHPRPTTRPPDAPTAVAGAAGTARAAGTAGPREGADLPAGPAESANI